MIRRMLPNRRPCELYDLQFEQIKYAVSIGHFEDQQPAEVFISSELPTSATANIARDTAILISLCLQYGVPVAVMRSAITRLSDEQPASIIGAILDSLGPSEDDV